MLDNRETPKPDPIRLCRASDAPDLDPAKRLAGLTTPALRVRPAVLEAARNAARPYYHPEFDAPPVVTEAGLQTAAADLGVSVRMTEAEVEAEAAAASRSELAAAQDALAAARAQVAQFATMQPGQTIRWGAGRAIATAAFIDDWRARSHAQLAEAEARAASARQACLEVA